MGRGLGWGTHRGPCQPLPFCDSDSVGSPCRLPSRTPPFPFPLFLLFSETNQQQPGQGGEASRPRLVHPVTAGFGVRNTSPPSRDTSMAEATQQGLDFPCLITTRSLGPALPGDAAAGAGHRAGTPPPPSSPVRGRCWERRGARFIFSAISSTKSPGSGAGRHEARRCGCSTCWWRSPPSLRLRAASRGSTRWVPPSTGAGPRAPRSRHSPRAAVSRWKSLTRVFLLS